MAFYMKELAKEGESSLRKTDYKTGTITKKIGLDPQYFGEGITFLTTNFTN